MDPVCYAGGLVEGKRQSPRNLPVALGGEARERGAEGGRDSEGEGDRGEQDAQGMQKNEFFGYFTIARPTRSQV